MFIESPHDIIIRLCFCRDFRIHTYNTIIMMLYNTYILYTHVLAYALYIIIMVYIGHCAIFSVDVLLRWIIHCDFYVPQSNNNIFPFGAATVRLSRPPRHGPYT